MADSMGDLLSDVISDTLTDSTLDGTLQSAPEQDADAPARNRADDGKFVSKKVIDPTLTDEENAAKEAERTGKPAETEAEPNVEALPDGMVRVGTIPSEGLAFKVLDGEGELEVPDMKVQYTANGKVRVDDLPQLVKMAQWGAYNVEKDQRAQQSALEAKSVAERNIQLESALKQASEERDWMLSKDENYLAARERYDALNTPEARLQRQADQLEQQQEEMQYREVAQQGQRMFNDELVPAIQAISNTLPYVTQDELGAKMLMAIEPFRVHTRFGSIVPPRAHEAVKQMLVNEIVPWAAELQRERTARFGTATAEATQKVKAAEQKADKATIETQKAKNLVSRATKPIGKSQRETKAVKPIVSVQDGMESSVASALAEMGYERH